MSARKSTLVVLAMLVAGLTLMEAVLQAEVLAKYNFNGRTASGTVALRSYSASHPYNGEDYVPNKEAGECGPILENPGPGGEQRGYGRSKYNNNGSDESKGRETLFLDCLHPFFLDFYRSKGEGALSAKGSFTWEIFVRIDRYEGTDHCCVLIDATKGEGLIPGWDGKSVVTRLWLGEKKGELFPLNFSIPISDDNKAVTVGTDLKLGEWYHIAAVYDDNEHKTMLYINGELKASADAISFSRRGTGFGIAGFGPDVAVVKHPGSLQKGFIDEMAFSNEDLTPGKFVIPVKK